MKKVLFLVPHLSTGGMPQYTYDLMRKIINDTQVYCIEYSMLSPHFIVQRTRIIDLLGDRFFCLGDNKENLFDFIDKIKPDIIHLQEIPEYFMENTIANRLYSSNRNYLLVETSHDSSFDATSKRFYPDHFALISEFQKKEFSKLGIPITLVESDIEYKPRRDRTEGLLQLGLDPNLKHVLNVGLFTPRKNQAEVISYARSLEDYPIQFHFVGNQADNFKSYWGPLLKKLPSNVKIWGERSDVDNFYSCMDMMLFTSRGTGNDKETSPLVIRESIGFELPTLIYDLPVYLGMYDKYGIVTYLNDDFESNKHLILDTLGLNRKERVDMNTAVIIDAYVNSPDKIHLLRECIKSASELGNTIILVSHCQIPDDILNTVDYHIFDRDNTFNNNHTYGFKKKEDVEVRINIHKSHEFPIIRSMRNAITFANSLGCDFFYFTEFDHVYSQSDIRKIKNLESKMIIEDKQFIIFHPLDAVFGDVKGVYYETCFFGGKTTEFLEIFDSYFPRDIESYNEKFAIRFPNCLEHFFYESMHPHKDKILLIEDYVKLFLNESQINISSYQNIKCEVIPSEVGTHYLYLANENTVPYTFYVYFDGVLQTELTMKNAFLHGDFSYLKLKHDCKILVDITDGHQTIKTEEIDYSFSKSEEYRKNGIIKFKDGEPNDKLFTISIDYDTNKLTFVSNQKIETPILVSIKDIDSKACIYSFEFPKSEKGTACWAIPLPVNVFSFKNDINFGGVSIEYYSKDLLLGADELRIKDVRGFRPVMNLTNTEPIYSNYKEFFIQKIYDGLDMDGCGVVIDAGANIGLWSKYILSRNPKQVYCLEPNQKALRDLTENMRENHNVIIVPKAISTSDGTIKFYEDRNSLISSIFPSGDGHEIEVESITFQTFLNDYKVETVDLFKMDIEGAEFSIIDSFGKNEFEKIDSFLIEYHEWNGGSKQQLVDKLISFGYHIQELSGHMYIFAYKQKKSYLIPPSTHQNYSQQNVSFSRVNLYESSKNFNWSDFNLGKYYIFDQMYNEMYREYEYNSTGCSYERGGCLIERGDIVVDIGANIGMFSNLAYERGATQIFAFEPTDLAYTCLLQNKPSNCETFKMAISDKEKLFEIISPREMDPMGAGIYKKKEESSISNYVYSTTIDRLFEEGLFDRIDFLKIDTEGAELAILNGISDVNLAKIRKISMEFHLNDLGEDSSDKIWKRIIDAGFKGFNLHYGSGELRMYTFWREN